MTGPHAPQVITSALTVAGSLTQFQCSTRSQIEPTTMIAIIAIFTKFISDELLALGLSDSVLMGLIAATILK